MMSRFKVSTGVVGGIMWGNGIKNNNNKPSINHYVEVPESSLITTSKSY
jgi:hypothetical protein